MFRDWNPRKLELGRCVEGRPWPLQCTCRRSCLKCLFFDSGYHSGEGERGCLRCSEGHLCVHNGHSCDCKGFSLVRLTNSVGYDRVRLV